MAWISFFGAIGFGSIITTIINILWGNYQRKQERLFYAKKEAYANAIAFVRKVMSSENTTLRPAETAAIAAQIELWGTQEVLDVFKQIVKEWFKRDYFDRKPNEAIKVFPNFDIWKAPDLLENFVNLMRKDLQVKS